MLPDIKQAIRLQVLDDRAAARLCVLLGWAPVHEVPLPNGRRADILALERETEGLLGEIVGKGGEG